VIESVLEFGSEFREKGCRTGGVRLCKLDAFLSSGVDLDSLLTLSV